MIELNNVSIKYVREYYTVCEFSQKIDCNSLFLDDDIVASSLFKAISKIDKFEGQIFIDKINLHEIKDKELPLAYIPSTPYLFKHKSLYQNLLYPLKIRRMNSKLSSILIDDAVNKFLLGTLSSKLNPHSSKTALEQIKAIKPSKLNEHEKQIVCLLRAVIRQPKYLLVENLFSTLPSEYHKVAASILNTYPGTIIACERKMFDFYSGFNIVNLIK